MGKEQKELATHVMCTKHVYIDAMCDIVQYR